MIRPVGRAEAAAIRIGHVPRKRALVIGPEAKAHADLPQIIDALGISGLALGSAQGRQKQRSENGDDGDDDKQLDQAGRVSCVGSG